MRGRRMLERAAAAAMSRRARTLAQVLLLAGAVFVLLRLRSVWHDSRVEARTIDWPLLVAAALVSGVAVTGTGLVWVAVLRRLGVAVGRWFVGIFLQSQLAKYIPGSVWQYAGRATLANAHGAPLRPVAVSLPIELVASSLAGAALTFLLLGPWGLVPAAVAVLVLGTVRSRGVERRLSAALQRVVGRRNVGGSIAAASWAVPPYAAILVVYGVAFWLTARALVAAPAADLVLYVGAFVAAWLAGLAAFYAPGGLGVREAVLVAVLRGKLGTSDALVVAAASRALLTVVDVVAALAGVAVTRRGAANDRAAAALLRDSTSRAL